MEQVCKFFKMNFTHNTQILRCNMYYNFIFAVLQIGRGVGGCVCHDRQEEIIIHLIKYKYRVLLLYIKNLYMRKHS